MVSMTNKDFNRLLSAAYKLSSNWEHFKMELQDQDSVEDQMDRIKDILVKYNNRKVEEKLLHISSRKTTSLLFAMVGSRTQDFSVAHAAEKMLEAI